MNDGMKEYTILWSIENYSYLSLKNGNKLISPMITLDGLEKTSWCLWLEEDKVEKGFKISFNLGRAASDAGPEDINIKLEVSLLSKDGATLRLKNSNKIFRKGNGCGFYILQDIEEVLVRRNAEYLFQDTLNVRCKIWYGEGNIHTVGNYFIRTRIGIAKFSFIHEVENFSALKPDEKNVLKNQFHSQPGINIISNVYFTDVLFHEGTVMFEIEPPGGGYILRKQKISLVDISRKVTECCEVDNRLDSTRKDIQKSPLSLTRKAIMNMKREYLPNDKLSLLCECTFSTGTQLNKIEEVQLDTPILEAIDTVISNNSFNIPEKLSACQSVVDDLKSIYSNQSLTDVVIKTKTKSFPAHRVVLCARSSVFKAMLTNDMKEKNTDCIQVDDLEDNTVQQFVLFLYSDNLENLCWESATKLYYAADKYAIEKLKLMCSSFLIRNLSTSTASELLLLADTHNDRDLKYFVENFILKHEDEVFGSDEWEKLIETNPQLVIKTMHLKYKKKKGGK